MQKLIPFSIDDIAFDPDEVAGAVNEACEQRRTKYKLRGVCRAYERIYFVLLPLKENEQLEEYLIKPIDDPSENGISAELENRWESGFDTIGSIQVDDRILGVFAKQPS